MCGWCWLLDNIKVQNENKYRKEVIICESKHRPSVRDLQINKCYRLSPIPMTQYLDSIFLMEQLSCSFPHHRGVCTLLLNGTSINEESQSQVPHVSGVGSLKQQAKCLL